MRLYAIDRGVPIHRRLVWLLTLVLTIALLAVVEGVPAEAEENSEKEESGEVVERPDRVSAAVTARLSGQRVKVSSLTTPTDEVFVNPDGSQTTESFLDPVRVQGENGVWQDLDLTLEKTEAGYEPKVSPTRTVFSAGGDDAFAQIADVEGKDLTWKWPSDLPEPQVEGETLTYSNVVENGDLVVRVLPGGFSHSIVLRAPPVEADEPLTIPVPLDLDGAKMSAADDGSLAVTAGKKELASAPAPVMWDAQETAQGDPANVAPVEAAVEGSGSDTELVLTPDADMLTDPQTQYPVTIDPTFTTYASGSVWVQSSGGYGTSAQLESPEMRVGTYNSGTVKARSFMKFGNISSWSGKQVTKAVLRLRNFSSYTCSNATVRVNRVTSAWSGYDVSWSSQPPITTAGERAQGTAPYGGPSGCGGEGFHSFDITSIAQVWSSSPSTAAYGLRLAALNETSNASWRKYRSAYYSGGTAASKPQISVTVNDRPRVPASFSVTPSTAAGSTTYTTAAKPKISVPVSDPEGQLVRAQIDISGGPTSVPLQTSVAVASGGTATKELPSLADGTYQVKVRAIDSLNNPSAYSTARTIVVDTTPPAAPTVACSGGFSSGQWYATRPSGSTTCAVNGSAGVAGFDWTLNNKAQPSVVSGASATLGTFTIPDNGVFGLSVKARDVAGNASPAAEFGFGSGDAGLVTPTDGERTSSTVSVRANAPADALLARVEHKGAEESEWTTATQVKRSSTFLGWMGDVAAEGSSAVTTGDLVWDVGAEADVKAPSSRQMRVCFVYTGVTRCTPARDVTLVPTAFGGSFPTQDLGPGQAALFTGEFSLDESDVSVPGFGGDLTLGRSHRSFAGQSSPSTGVFGPGWVADLQGPDAGQGAVEVADHTADEAAITLVSPDGESSTYVHEDGVASPQRAGAYVGDAETETENDVLEIESRSGTKYLMLEEDDGTVTEWKHLGDGQWVISQVEDPFDTSTTRYTHDAEGLVTGIYAPSPDGVTCTAADQDPGCRALTLVYDTIDGDKRLVRVDLRIWDPKPGADGKPSSSAGMRTVTVAKYAYDSGGRLGAAWDPRTGDGESALKTQYEYTTSGSKTRLTKVTPAGQTPWRFDYDSQGRISTVKRAHPVAVGSGDATWTVDYDTALHGDGLPDLRESATSTWGQPAGPVAGATVFGPNAPGTTDPTYGTISYWDVEGRTTNTVTYGAGAWQVDSSGYDAHGNTVWALDEGNRNRALTSGGDSVAVAHSLATLTTYNEAGTRVEKTLGPTRAVVLDNGDQIDGRDLSTTVYDDEASEAGVPAPGRPTPDPDAPALNRPVEERDGVADADGNTYDITRTRYRYDPVVTGDSDGWVTGTATRTSVELGSGWSTTLARQNAEGFEVETRTPQGIAAVDGSANDPRSRVTVYYTADASASVAECRNKPAWAGLECQVGPAGQPSGNPVPVTTTTGYDYLLSPTRVEETSGSTTRVSRTEFDDAGRKTAEKAAVSGTPSGDQGVDDVAYAYSSSTGELVSTSAGSKIQTTTYDSWGRVLTQSDGAGNTATTTYDTAGRVKTLDDGKGVYTYTYDGTDAAGKTERRGLVTKLDVGLGSGPDEFTTAADADGNTVLTTYPNGMKASSAFDAAGTQRSLEYAANDGTEIIGFSALVDVNSKIRQQSSAVSEQTFGYDGRDRLVRVEDSDAQGCVTRRYGFSLDSNRESRATSGPAADGSCTTANPDTVTSSFDAGDRITGGGYTYDNLGRTRTVPKAHTDQVGQASASDLSVAYHANDMVASLTQTVPDGEGTSAVARVKSFTLDPANRLSRTQDTRDGVTLRKTTNHYSDGGDAPAWIEVEERNSAAEAWATAWSRNVLGPDGDLAMITTGDGQTKIQVTNLHGDVVTQLDNNDVEDVDVYHETTEYGLAKTPDTSLGQHYEWLGAKRRSSDSLGGLTLMGVRLYNPTTGRFLSTDPVYGGNDNTYVYPPDPINKVDLDGNWWSKRRWRKIGKWAGYAALGACTIGTGGACAAATGVVIAANVAANRRKLFGRGVSKRNRAKAWGSLAWDASGARVKGLRIRGAVGGKRATHPVTRGRRWSRPHYKSMRYSYTHTRRRTFYARGAYQAASGYKTYRGW